MKRLLRINAFCVAIFVASLLFAQKPVKEFRADDLREEDVENLQKEYSNRKTIPSRYRKPILTALRHFPELKDLAA